MRDSTTVLVVLLVALAAFVPLAAADGTTATATDVDCEYPRTLTDATGEEVTIDEAPESVVAVQPSDAQLLTEIGAADAMVGMPVGPYTDHLDAPDDVTDVSADDGVTPVAERVIDLDADVVLAANTVLFVEGFVEQLRDAGQTVYVYDAAGSIDEVRENVRIAGFVANECDRAEETIAEMDDRLETIESAVPDEDRPLAYYVMGEDDFTTAGTETFQHEILETAGVENIAERADIEGWEEISEEVVIEEDPEWIIYGESLGEPPEMEALQATTAWQEDQFVAVDDNAMSQPGPHVVEAIEEIASTVHPEAYENATGEASETTGADENGDDGTDDSLPGFGAPVAAGALALAIGLLGRRG